MCTHCTSPDAYNQCACACASNTHGALTRCMHALLSPSLHVNSIYMLHILNSHAKGLPNRSAFALGFKYLKELVQVEFKCKGLPKTNPFVHWSSTNFQNGCMFFLCKGLPKRMAFCPGVQIFEAWVHVSLKFQFYIYDSHIEFTCKFEFRMRN